jgi:hypothetical protein
MEFFPEPVAAMEEPEELPQPAWMTAPGDMLPGVVPVEIVIGRSPSTVVLLTGMRVFPTGIEMTLGVRVRGRVRRRELHGEVFDGPYSHDRDDDWQAGRLKWGFELADGRRVTNVDPPPWPPERFDPSWEPAHPVLMGHGGGGGNRAVDREYWLWPLPPTGRLQVACQWLDQGIDMTVHDLDVQPFLAAAARARSVWPGG